MYWHRSLSSFLTVLLSKISLNELAHDLTSVTSENSIAGVTVWKDHKKLKPYTQ